MKEKLHVTAMDWDKVPESNRHQLMTILGEMAYNAVKSNQTVRRKADEGNTTYFSPYVLHPPWENTAASPRSNCNSLYSTILIAAGRTT
jgi:hypothetical protein